MSEGLQVKFFGNFEVIRDGEVIPNKSWPQRKTQTLLKILLHQRGQTYSQDQLIDLLFTEQDPESASRNLHKRVSELRRILEPELKRGQESKFVVRLGQGYALSQEESCWTDLEEYALQIREAKESQDDGDWALALESFERALELYRGDFLDEDRYEEWTLEVRDRWRERNHTTLEGATECRMRQGHYPLAIESAQQALSANEFAENVYRQLLVSFWRSGEQSRVSQIYQRCVEALEELGVEPSGETERIFENIQNAETEELERIYPPLRTVVQKSTQARVENPRSIAVLPFVNVSPDPENEYFSDGLTEELINALTRIEELQITSRTTAFAFKNKNLPLHEIGEQLGVATALEGSVRKAGNRVRVTVQLVQIADETQLWSERYDRELEDIFAIQDEITQHIVANLKLTLTSEENELLTKHYTDNLDAYNLYLQGRYFWNKRSMDSLTKAIELFEEAIALDSEYALAYAGLADSYNILSEYDWLSPAETMPKAREAALKALEIDETLAEAHASYGYVCFYYDWDFKTAEYEFKRSIELDPQYPIARMWYSNFLMAMGRKDQSLNEIRVAQDLEPLSTLLSACAGSMCYFAREYDEAIEYALKSLEMEPQFGLANVILTWSYEQKQMFKDAISQGKQAIDLINSPQVLSYLGHAYAASGEEENAKIILEDLKKQSKERFVSPMCIATIYAGLEDFDEAFAWLEKAYEVRSFDITYLNVWPMVDNLRSDPRFSDLLEKIGLPIISS
jgi:TolB-like protein/DNA-binding winged helix-turn-helix (wHTH) protein